jgi:hypothetical protein
VVSPSDTLSALLALASMFLFTALLVCRKNVMQLHTVVNYPRMNCVVI